MLKLTLLGGVALSRDGVSNPWIQRGWQRGGLFALLAASQQRGIDRELLATLLWPDTMEAAGRHSLDELLSRARRELGTKDLFTGSTFIALNSEVVATDVDEFDAAIAAQHLERAVELYHGPFADGLRLSSADGAERRIVAARLRLSDAFHSAVEALARRTGERGDHRTAARWWQRLAQHDPLSARVAKALLSSLIAAGENAHALSHIRIYRALLLGELGTAVDEEILQIEQQLRSSGSTLSPSPIPAKVLPDAQTGAGRVTRLQRLLTRCLGAIYTLGNALEQGTVVSSYQIRRRDNAVAAELHVMLTAMNGADNAERFQAIFERVQSLSHPGIVPLLDCGLVDETPFWITAPRARETLRDVLRRGRALPLAEAVPVARALAMALRHAHERNVYHGDLRPKRISMTHLQLAISGFGLAELLFGTLAGDLRSSTAFALGSPLYQSPEQLWDGTGADVSSDIYAFGCIVYELLGGEPPFGPAAGVALVRRKLAGDVLPLRQLRDTVPAETEQLVMQCLARAPGDRGVEVPVLG